MNIRKVLYLALFSLTLSSQLIAQDSKLIWSDTYKDAPYGSPDIVGFDEDSYFVTYSKHRAERARLYQTAVSLSKFNHQLELEKTVQIKMERDGKVENFESIISTSSSNLFLITSHISRDKNGHMLSVREIDKTSLEVSSDKMDIQTADLKEMDKDSFYGNYEFSLSPDSSKLLISYRYSEYGKSDVKYGLLVFDEHMNQLSKKEIKLPYKNRQFETRKLNVSNEGNVYFAGKLSPEKQKKSKDKLPTEAYKIIQYNFQADELITQDLEPSNILFYDVGLAVFPKAKVICTGIYINPTTEDKGLYTCTLNPKTLEIQTETQKRLNLEDFNPRLWEKVQQEKKQKKKDELKAYFEIDNFVISAIAQRPHNNFLLLLEDQSYTQWSQSYTNPGMTHMSYQKFNFYNGDVLGIKLDNQLQVETIPLLKKNQTSMSLKYKYIVSYFLINTSTPKLLFNDHADNIPLPEDEIFKSIYDTGKSAKKSVVTTSLNGDNNRESLVSLSDIQGHYLNARASKHISATVSLLIFEQENTWKLAKLTLSETE